MKHIYAQFLIVAGALLPVNTCSQEEAKDHSCYTDNVPERTLSAEEDALLASRLKILEGCNVEILASNGGQYNDDYDDDLYNCMTDAIKKKEKALEL